MKSKSALLSKRLALRIAVIHMVLHFALLILLRHSEQLLKIGTNALQVTAACLAAVWLFQAYKKEKKTFRHVWLFASLASVSYLVAMGFYIYYDLYLQIEPPFPGTADLFWLLMIVFYLMMFFHIALWNKRPVRVVQFVIDTSIVMVAATIISWEFLIKHIVSSSSEYSFLHKVVYLGYPVGDLGILFGLLAAFRLTNLETSSKTFFFMFAGTISFLAGDSWYLYLVSNDLYTTGHFVELFWPAGMLMFSLAAFYYEETSLHQQTDKTKKTVPLQLLLPYASVAFLTIAAVWKENSFNGLMTGMLITVLLIVMRQILTLSENNLLLEKFSLINKELEEKVEIRTKELSRKNKELEHSIQKAEFLAYHDTLTGLVNRRYFEEVLAEMVTKTTQQQAAVLFLDLDRFKLINDTYSHSIGDLLLIETAKRLRSCLGPEETICRQGGDEFLILLPHATLEEAAAAAAKINEALSKRFSIEEQDIYITCSIGISLFPDHGQKLDLLIKHADTAMYAVKGNGKNGYQMFSSQMNVAVSEKLYLEAGLRKAIERNEFVVHYQPRVEVAARKIVGMEALLYWNHPELGFVSPYQFIPLAEETGLIHEIGNWVMNEACRQTKEWQKQGLPPLCVSVNVSALQFSQENFYEKIEQALLIHQLNPACLEIEITESMMRSATQLLVLLRKLRKLGVKVSLDDFGSGFSSLNQLKHLPLDTLKIDKGFIDDLTTDPKDQAIFTAILTLGKSLGLTVLAEGVEKKEQLRFLENSGCDHIQGYIIAPPLPPSEFAEMLQTNSTLSIVR